jgi:lipopolysaccharide export system permease protein
VTTLVVLLTVVMSNMLIQTLGQASRGVLNPSDVILVMGLTALGYSATLLTLSLFLAIISTLSRMYSDSEMVIWFSSGQSLSSFALPVLRFAWPVLVCIFFSALVVWPWSNKQVQDLRHKFESRNDIERVSPGKFLEFSGGTGVFFIDKDSASNVSGTNVFISRTEGDWNIVISAKQGHVEHIKDERFLTLVNGQQVSTNAKTHETRIVSFQNYQLLIDDSVAAAALAPPVYTMPSLSLIEQGTPSDWGELSWRVGQGLCALNLVFLAIALATVNPRAAKSYHLMKAILVFIIYYNMINFGQRWVTENRMSFLPMLLSLHGTTTILALAWIKAQEINTGIRLPWPWRRSAA